MDYHFFHWRFISSTVPVDIGQDKVEGDVLDEVPEEESDVDARFQQVGQHQQARMKVHNFQVDGVLPIVECTWGVSGVEEDPHAGASPKLLSKENEDCVVVGESITFLQMVEQILE